MSLYAGDKVYLRAVERGDIERGHRWINDWEVRQYLMPGPAYPISVDEEQKWFESTVHPSDGRSFAIVTVDGDVHIGNCGFHRLDWKNRKAEIGIMIGEKTYWGKGYGTDALRVLLRVGFDELNLNRLSLHVYAFNIRAIAAYEKVGFRHEGTYRESIFRHGRYHDELVMAILAREYREPAEERAVGENKT